MIFLTISQHYVFFTEELGKVCVAKETYCRSDLYEEKIFYYYFSRKNVKSQCYAHELNSITISACLTKCKNACLTEVEEIHSAEMF